MTAISERIKTLRATLPPTVELVAAAKTRSAEEAQCALNAGITVLGHNYVQEAADMIAALGRNAATWTMIGHLQRNKVKTAVQLFDSVQTVDSLRLAAALDRACQSVGRVLPILIEINAAREPQKAGVSPEEAEDLIREIAPFSSIQIQGLMTMGPWGEDPEALRPIFRDTKILFDHLATLGIPGVSMSVLSMGMSASYAVAVEEGATMIRVGTTIFGPRS